MRVGVPPLFTHLPPQWSSGKIWSNVIERLAADAEIVVATPSSIAADAVDVWLWDGHQGPLGAAAPIVAHIHEAPWGDPEVLRTVNPDWVAKVDASSRAAAAEAACLATGSESGKAQLVERFGVAPESVHVALNGVDHRVYRPDGPAGDAVVRGLGGGNRPYVLFVGSLLPRKNLPLLRSAMGVLHERGLPHDLVLVLSAALDRPDSSALLAEATAPIGDRPVLFTTAVSEEDLASLMRGASLLCLPSVTEGFGMPVVEAMACGTPAVVSDRGSLPEVLGDGGIAVPPTEADLVGALEQVLGSPALRTSLSERALVQAQAFTWDRTAAAMLGALRSVARRQPST